MSSTWSHQLLKRARRCLRLPPRTWHAWQAVVGRKKVERRCSNWQPPTLCTVVLLITWVQLLEGASVWLWERSLGNDEWIKGLQVHFLLTWKKGIGIVLSCRTIAASWCCEQKTVLQAVILKASFMAEVRMKYAARPARWHRKLWAKWFFS